MHLILSDGLAAARPPRGDVARCPYGLFHLLAVRDPVRGNSRQTRGVSTHVEREDDDACPGTGRRS